MTIGEMIDFLERSAKNCEHGRDTHLRWLQIDDGFHRQSILAEDANFVLEKKYDSMAYDEYVNLLIEEEL